MHYVPTLLHRECLLLIKLVCQRCPEIVYRSYEAHRRRCAPGVGDNEGRPSAGAAEERVGRTPALGAAVVDRAQIEDEA